MITAKVRVLKFTPNTRRGFSAVSDNFSNMLQLFL